jgi:hypothetical protein
MKRSMHFLSIALVTLMAAPALAQMRSRDYRQSQPVQRYVSPSVSSYSPSAGTPGTIVTIRGQNFARGTMVVYGGNLVTPTRVTASAITFAIPARSRSQSIALRVPGIRGDLSVGSFAVRSPAPPPRSYDPVWSLEQDLRSSRSNRRARSQRSLLQRWERAFLADRQVRNELALHAERTASLQRMLRLASHRRDASLRARINVAMARENARHQRQMQILRANFRFG